MKHIILGLFGLLTFNSNAQTMDTPINVVTGMFVSTDLREWADVERAFAETVELDYSSMNGNPSETLSPAQIVSAWKGILPGFTSTHHQVGNFVVTEQEDSAHVFCYGTATHYLEDGLGNIWTVVGTYDFDLIKSDQNKWQIKTMRFNYKYQDGNTTLPQKAMNSLK